MTKRIFPDPIQSISDRIWLITRSDVSELSPPLPLARAMESISSKQRMRGKRTEEPSEVERL